MQSYIRLHEKDNVVIALKDFLAGESFSIDGRLIKLHSAVNFGHKIAVRAIARGEKVLKYGLAIGSATTDILPGDHVHVHNLETDYSVDKS